MSAAAPALAGYTWTLGVKVGLPFAIVGFVLLLAALAFCIKHFVPMRRDWKASKAAGKPSYARPDIEIPVIGLVVVALCLAGLVVGCLFGYYPYGAEYHQYRDVHGTVSRISSRFIPAGDDGDGTEQRFVVVLQGTDRRYAIDDTRAALLHPGDHVNLRCIREHVSGSTDDGYACQWGSAS